MCAGIEPGASFINMGTRHITNFHMLLACNVSFTHVSYAMESWLTTVA